MVKESITAQPCLCRRRAFPCDAVSIALRYTLNCFALSLPMAIPRFAEARAFAAAAAAVPELVELD